MPGHWLSHKLKFEHVFDKFCLQTNWDKSCPIVDIGYGCLPIDSLTQNIASKRIVNPIVRVDPNKLYAMERDNMKTIMGKMIARSIPDPDFPTVPQLCQQCPELVGQCMAVLIWPWRDQTQPSELARNHNCGSGSSLYQSAGYDMLAIELLRPRAFLTIYSDNSAGSPEFVEWLRSDSKKHYFLASSRTVMTECEDSEVFGAYHCELYVRHSES